MRPSGSRKAGSAGPAFPAVPPAILLTFFLALILPFALASCGGGKPDISAYEDMPIVIKGLAEDEFETTPAELAGMDCVSESDTGGSDKAGTVEAYGPTLDTFLSAYGKQRSDFGKIRFTGKDAYHKTIWGEMLEEKEIILSIANGKEPLKDSEAPMRLLIPGAEPNYWVYSVVEIEFTDKEKGIME